MQAVSIVLVQILLPLAALVWLAIAPARSRLGYAAQVIATGFLLLALLLIPIWLVPPWWTPYVYALIGVFLLIRNASRGRGGPSVPLPATVRGRIGAGLGLLVGGALGVLSMIALAGRSVPLAEAVDLAFPLGSGTYLVASGGSTEIVNGHLLTLSPATLRQRAYRGQSYGVDVVELGPFGLTAPGWRPRDPQAYAIFGAPVYAPCAGTVLKTRNDLPDAPVPAGEERLLEGNHVFLDCGEYGVLLAHFRNGSVRVAVGDRVRTGDQLAEAGNSGRSDEPHLHIHAQRIPDSGPLLSGEPLYVTFDRRFLVRNERVVVANEASPPP